MRRDWKEMTLDEVCHKVTDGSHFSPQEVENGYLMASSKDMLENGFDYSNIKRIGKKDYEKLVSSDCQPLKDDILIIKDGNSYLKYIFSVNKDEEIVVLSSIAILRPNTEIVNSKFLQYYLRNPVKKDEMGNFVSGSAIPRIVLKDFKKLPVSIPSLETQQKIASILSAYDDLIENNLRRIKILEEMAAITYKEWFVNFMVDGQALEIDGETGLPVGWEVKEFQFFGEIVTGKTPSTFNEEYFDGDIPFVKTPDMSGFPYVVSTNQTLSDKGGNSQKNKFLPKNSLMISCIGSAGVYALVAKDCQTNQQINSIKFFEEFYCFYFYCIAKTLKPLLEALGSNGATMTNVNKGKFEKIKATYPTKNILVSFHGIVRNNFEIILNLQNQNRLLKESRDILLPRLMNGEIIV